MGQEFSKKPNEQRYEQRYKIYETRYVYCMGIFGIIVSWGGFQIRHKLPDGILSVVILSFVLFLFYMKGTPPLLLPLSSTPSTYI